jgi:aspartyl protease family protein
MFARTLLLVSLAAFGLAFATLRIADWRGTDDDAVPVAASVAADPAATPKTLPRYGASTVLTRGMDGHFMADVRLNGQPLRMLVDSGASMIVINESQARALGIAPPPSAYTGRAMTANGEIRFAPVRIASVRIGDVERIDVPAGVMEGDSLGTPLLGQSFLAMLQEVTIRGDRMELK